MDALFGSTKIYHDTSCSFCLEDYQLNTDNRLLLLGCGHLFHPGCVKNLPECPLCRRTITTFPSMSEILKLSLKEGYGASEPYGRAILSIILIALFIICIEGRYMKFHEFLIPWTWVAGVLTISTVGLLGIALTKCCYSSCSHLKENLSKKEAKEILYRPTIDS